MNIRALSIWSLALTATSFIGAMDEGTKLAPGVYLARVVNNSQRAVRVSLLTLVKCYDAQEKQWGKYCVRNEHTSFVPLGVATEGVTRDYNPVKPIRMEEDPYGRIEKTIVETACLKVEDLMDPAWKREIWREKYRVSNYASGFFRTSLVHSAGRRNNDEHFTFEPTEKSCSLLYLMLPDNNFDNILATTHTTPCD